MAKYTINTAKTLKYMKKLYKQGDIFKYELDFVPTLLKWAKKYSPNDNIKNIQNTIFNNNKFINQVDDYLSNPDPDDVQEWNLDYHTTEWLGYNLIDNAGHRYTA